MNPYVRRVQWIASDFSRTFGIPIDVVIDAVENGDLPARRAGALIVLDDLSATVKFLQRYRAEHSNAD